MLHISQNQENQENKFYFLTYKGNGKNTGFDFSALEINGKSICRYVPEKFLKDEPNLFQPFVSHRTMLHLILLDKKGKVSFLHSEDFFHVLTLLDKSEYDVNTFGPHYTVTIKKTVKHHD